MQQIVTAIIAALAGGVFTIIGEACGYEAELWGKFKSGMVGSRLTIPEAD